jgi:Tfp pilus assembly protein PilE
MNKKTFTLIGLLVALAAVAIATYNSFSQLKDVDYDLFGTEDDDD